MREEKKRGRKSRLSGQDISFGTFSRCVNPARWSHPVEGEEEEATSARVSCQDKQQVENERENKKAFYISCVFLFYLPRRLGLYKSIPSREVEV